MKKIFFLLCLTSLTPSISSMEADSEDSQKSGKASLASSVSSTELARLDNEDSQKSEEIRLDIANIENMQQNFADMTRLINDNHQATKTELEKIKERQKANGLSLCITGGISCLSAIGIFALLNK